MTAAITDFHRGDRIRLTHEANLTRSGSVRTGVVTSTMPEKGLIRVRRDGRKAIETWSPTFWRKQP